MSTEENQAAEAEKEKTPEVTLIHALQALTQAIECSACTDSRRVDELMIVDEYIMQNVAKADDDPATDDTATS